MADSISNQEDTISSSPAPAAISSSGGSEIVAGKPAAGKKVGLACLWLLPALLFFGEFVSACVGLAHYGDVCDRAIGKAFIFGIIAVALDGVGSGYMMTIACTKTEDERARLDRKSSAWRGLVGLAHLGATIWMCVLVFGTSAATCSATLWKAGMAFAVMGLVSISVVVLICFFACCCAVCLGAVAAASAVSS